MGNYKKKKQKLEMKFFAFVALLGSAAAIKLTHQAPKVPHSMVKTHVKHKWENLTDEQEAEVEAWVTEQLTTGDGKITKEEAHDALVAFGEAHGFEPIPDEAWEELEAMFDAVDTNGDGAIDLAELEAVM